ncbi:hypothetical protein E2C01_094151 [Portunus trituberculatus]|uniref:Uncharacterized protein n=1 Tax=Portunus trituberculatus TaxID=210409 RepID=A0A5B7JPP0_PORTR|nr:hypothetical protein [Portunus trituberculatus]
MEEEGRNCLLKVKELEEDLEEDMEEEEKEEKENEVMV